MREILFRGKRCNNGEWAEGCLIRDEFCNTDIPYIGYLSDYDIGAVEVYPKTVGQFTGLTDKNGKKIFEGDIVRHYNRQDAPELYSMGRIFWEDKSCKFRRTTDSYKEIVNISADCVYEVIGNIYDQPELVMPPKGE